MNTEVNEEFAKKKKIILISIIVSVALFFIILVLLVYFNYKDSQKTRLLFDGKTYTIESSNIDGQDTIKGAINYNNHDYDLFCVEGDEYYFNIETICKLTGYDYKKGEYNPVNESSDKCYIINEGEYSSYALDSDIVKKQYYNDKEQNDSNNNIDLLNDTREIYTVDKKVKRFNNQLYASANAISTGFNMQVTTDGTNIIIYSLPYLIQGYSELIKDEYDSISSDFKNQRALAKDLIVVEEDNKYGIYSGKDNKELVSTKYDNLEYVGNINQFIANFSGKMGMLSVTSDKPTIEIQYDSIELIDSEDVLYLVSKEDKYGIISGDGKIIVPIEYDNIGIDNEENFSSQNIDNKYIFFNKLIIASVNNKYSIYSKTGEHVQDVQYDSLGCTNASTVVQSQDNIVFENTLLINYKDTNDNVINGIVFQLGDKYGIIDENGKILIQPEWDSIFYVKNDDDIQYYLASSELGIVKNLNEII